MTGGVASPLPVHLPLCCRFFGLRSLAPSSLRERGVLFAQTRRNLHDRIFDSVAQLVDLPRRDRQRRRQRQDVAANSDPDAAAFQRVGESPSDAHFGREGLLGFTVCNQLEPLPVPCLVRRR